MYTIYVHSSDRDDLDVVIEPWDISLLMNRHDLVEIRLGSPPTTSVVVEHHNDAVTIWLDTIVSFVVYKNKEVVYDVPGYRPPPETGVTHEGDATS
jgi:hypothetical protein